MMDFVNGKDDNPYMKWKIKVIFETTNQLNIHFPMVSLWFSYGFPMIMFETTNQHMSICPASSLGPALTMPCVPGREGIEPSHCESRPYARNFIV